MPVLSPVRLNGEAARAGVANFQGDGLWMEAALRQVRSTPNDEARVHNALRWQERQWQKLVMALHPKFQRWQGHPWLRSQSALPNKRCVKASA